MHFEVEQKFRVTSFTGIRAGLEQLGVASQPAIEQVDIYFNHPARDFAETDEALRLRRVGERNCVTYKGPKSDLETKTRREIELSIEPAEAGFEQFSELLVALGFARVAEVRKRRTVFSIAWKGWPVVVALDEVDSLGRFVEVELTCDESHLDEARRTLSELVKGLKLTKSERRSYLELLLA